MPKNKFGNNRKKSPKKNTKLRKFLLLCLKKNGITFNELYLANISNKEYHNMKRYLYEMYGYVFRTMLDNNNHGESRILLVGKLSNTNGKQKLFKNLNNIIQKSNIDDESKKKMKLLKEINYGS